MTKPKIFITVVPRDEHSPASLPNVIETECSACHRPAVLSLRTLALVRKHLRDDNPALTHICPACADYPDPREYPEALWFLSWQEVPTIAELIRPPNVQESPGQTVEQVEWSE